ncbi:IS701 family transposase [Parafrankia sp. FMc2]|uniref:IS701 family transposase n=1 Tax=Parafrankia sp. FMc2 TaxID=3233196 RepID=UPI0034D4A53A
MTTDSVLDARAWIREVPDELDLLHGRVAHRFGRPEPRRRALAYLRGLVALPGARHGQALASAAGETSPDGMQRLLTAAGWDADLVRDDLLDYVRERYVHAHAALVVDEVVFPGRGPRFVGAAPRYLAETGRVESCQVAVLAAYDTPEHSMLVDRELCLPSPWDTDRRLRHAAGVPDERQRSSTRELAGEAVSRGLRRLPLRWIVLGPALGSDDRLRSWLARHDIAFAARIHPGTALGTTMGRRVTAAALSAAVSSQPAGEGPGPGGSGLGAPGRGGAPGATWTQVRVRPSRGGRWEHRLLVERVPMLSLHRGSLAVEPRTFFYACHVPRGTSLDETVEAARRADAVQLGVRRAREAVGLDSYRVRGWTGWHRHLTLAMLAAAGTGGSPEVRLADRSAAS